VLAVGAVASRELLALFEAVGILAGAGLFRDTAALCAGVVGHADNIPHCVGGDYGADFLSDYCVFDCCLYS
jgi:hypothetical protein